MATLTDKIFYRPISSGNQIPFKPCDYQIRRRIKITGMGYSFKNRQNTIIISGGTSHDWVFPIRTLGYTSGFKNRTLLFRIKTTNYDNTSYQMFSLFKTKPANAYRKKGLVIFGGKYHFKKGKKKFV
jgi:hypothetical protein